MGTLQWRALWTTQRRALARFPPLRPITDPNALSARFARTQNHPFKIFMGYDSHEDITFEVAKYSIESRSSVPVDIIPLKRKELQVRNA